MRIGNTVPPALQAYTEQSRAKTVKNKAGMAGEGGKDEVVLSSSAQSFAALLQKVKGQSDVRPEKVREVSARVADGTYHADARMIAEKMLGSCY